MKKCLLILVLLSVNIKAAIFIDISHNLTSYTETVSSSSTNIYKDMINKFALASTLDNAERIHFGYDVELLSRTYGTDTLKLTNMGPKFDYSFGHFYLSFAWHPYVSGTRVVSSATDKITGNAIAGGFGFKTRISKTFFVGASINYNAVKITKSINSSNVSSTVTDKYTFIYPTLEFKLRFK